MVRFGLFTYDPSTGALKRGDRVVKLRPQPAQLLALLTRHPGELVTREQIRDALWRGETFVDYDLGINSAVRQLRTALGDDAETPRYVQTVPRKGYRFITPLEDDAPAARQRFWPALAAAAVVGAALIAYAVLPRRSEPELARAKPSVAVLLFDNVSEDESLDWLRTGITDARPRMVLARPGPPRRGQRRRGVPVVHADRRERERAHLVAHPLRPELLLSRAPMREARRVRRRTGALPPLLRALERRRPRSRAGRRGESEAESAAVRREPVGASEAVAHDGSSAGSIAETQCKNAGLMA